LNSPPPLLFAPRPFLEYFQQVSFFMYIHVHTFLHCIHPPTQFPCHPHTHFHRFQPPTPQAWLILFSNFVEEKRKKLNKRLFLYFGHAKLFAKTSQIRWSRVQNQCEWNNVN
jgi:hypothetical protein